MANKHLLLKPHEPRDESFWWYELNGGIEIYVPAHVGAIAKVIKIPWRSLRAALARKDKPVAKGGG